MTRVGDYSKFKIYKITSMNNPELVYYGHTCQPLSHRFSQHKSHLDTFSKYIIEKGDAIILLIEDYPCETEDQARAREAFYILNNPCVNKQIPNRPEKEWRKEYREIHKNDIKEQARLYRESHKEEMRENRIAYETIHKEDIKQRKKQYYIDNIEKIKNRQEQYRLTRNEEQKKEQKDRRREYDKVKYQKAKLLKSQLLNNEPQTTI